MVFTSRQINVFRVARDTSSFFIRKALSRVAPLIFAAVESGIVDKERGAVSAARESRVQEGY